MEKIQALCYTVLKGGCFMSFLKWPNKLFRAKSEQSSQHFLSKKPITITAGALAVILLAAALYGFAFCKTAILRFRQKQILLPQTEAFLLKA